MTLLPNEQTAVTRFTPFHLWLGEKEDSHVAVHSAGTEDKSDSVDESTGSFPKFKEDKVDELFMPSTQSTVYGSECSNRNWLPHQYGQGLQ